MSGIIKARKYSRIIKMSEKELVIKEIEDVRFLMKLAYFKLSMANDNALVESAVLELRSLEIKHAYLLNKLRDMEK